ncbi:MAG TPA: hypothetical protein VGF14_06495 [Alphaproteobacteria bacterium]
MMRTAYYTGLATLTSFFYSALAMAQDVVADPAVDAVAAETVSHAADHAEKSAGLPQLDMAQYPSQLFWLALTGITLYVLMAKFALPRIADLQKERDHFVHDHLRQAAEVRHLAEDAKINYDIALRQAEAKAKNVLVETTETIRQKHDQALNDAMQKIQHDTEIAEARLDAQKQLIMQNVDKQAAQLADEIIRDVFPAKVGRAA